MQTRLRRYGKKKTCWIEEHIEYQQEDRRGEQLMIPGDGRWIQQEEKETSNGPRLAAKLTRLTCGARNRGLRPHVKSPRLGRGMFTCNCRSLSAYCMNNPFLSSNSNKEPLKQKVFLRLSGFLFLYCAAWYRKSEWHELPWEHTVEDQRCHSWEGESQ